MLPGRYKILLFHIDRIEGLVYPARLLRWYLWHSNNGSFNVFMRSKIIMTMMLMLLTSPFAVAAQCPPANTWWHPGNQQTAMETRVLDSIRDSDVVLIGEHHANESHHTWHLQMLNNMSVAEIPMVLGLEVFPRQMQPVLDDWVAGKLRESEFIEKIQWDEIWGYDLSYYLPLFHFARDHAIPMVALNVSKSLLLKVKDKGWDAVPPHQREGVSDPARPERPYLYRLAASFMRHNIRASDEMTNRKIFLRFVQQQLLWDRAMAEAISGARGQYPERKVVAIMGSWHMIDGHGVPYQLADLINADVMTIVPWDDHLECEDVNPRFSDWIYRVSTH
jgi:uncharacterized iron-regulated protein